MRYVVIGFLALGLVACGGDKEFNPDISTDAPTDTTTDTTTDTIPDGAGVCGDGTVDDGEECDDGNTDDTDACLSTCEDASCGDGFVWSGTEECDDGTDNSDTTPDACRTDCTAAACGDGVTDTGEDCDDENLDDTDGCLSTCVDASCGDGFVQTGVEECDDGTDNSDTAADACRTDCTDAGCGDGVTDTGEDCDDENLDDTDDCLSTCVDASCGDGFVHAGVEECDDGTANSDTTPDACRTTCLDAHCGDSVTDTGEECDDGNTTDGDGCDNDCTESCIPTLYSFSRTTTSEDAPTTLNTTSKTDASLLTAIGLTGVGQITAASFDTTTGRLFTSHGGGGCCPVPGFTACLMETDISTGATTVVGCDPTYGGVDVMPGLAVNSTGDIYGMLLACNAGPMDCDIYLVSVNKTTGAITVIGRTAEWYPPGHGMAFGPGDILYYQNDADGFGTIDLTTGVFTAIGESFVGFPSTSFTRVNDMAYDSVAGVMYATVSAYGTSSLATVDLTTGTFTYLGTFPEQTASIAIPCP